MNPDPSLCRLIANPHRLKKNDLKITTQDKSKDHITNYIRSRYNHLYITSTLLSNIEMIISDYIREYEVDLVCDDIIKRVIQNTIQESSTLIGFDMPDMPDPLSDQSDCEMIDSGDEDDQGSNPFSDYEDETYEDDSDTDDL